MIVPLPRRLKQGDKGQDVLMVKRAISRAGYRRWGVGFTKTYGPILADDIRKFQKDHKIPATGSYGVATHTRLAHYFDAYGANEMIKLWKAEQETPVDVAVMQNLIAHNYAWQNDYTQGSARMQIVRLRIKDLTGWYRRGNRLEEDCSSFQTGAAFIGGCANPNSGTHEFSQEGYTGTMAVHGVRLKKPRKGALGFFGNSWPYHHVVRALENGDNPLCGSHGRPGFDLERISYRNDFSHWRFYD